MKYKVYFEIYDKKMVTEIEANSKEDAEYKLRGKIQIHKIEEIQNVKDFGIIDKIFNEFLNIKKP